MAKKVTVREVMAQLKRVELRQRAQRAVLRKCPVKFLKEMTEVIRLESASSFWRVPMTGQKKYYLDMLTHVQEEDLPTEKLKRDEYARQDWVHTREVPREYLKEWQEYLA